MEEADSNLQEYALNDNPKSFCDFLTKTSSDVNLKVLSNTFNARLSAGLLFFKVEISDDGIKSINENALLNDEQKVAALGLLQMLHIEESLAVELVQLAQESRNNHPFHPLLCIASQLYFENVIKYYRCCEFLLSFDLDHVMIERLKRAVGDCELLKDKLQLVTLFFELFHYKPLELLRKRGLRLAFYDQLVTYELKYTCAAQFVQLYEAEMAATSPDEAPFQFKGSRAAALWKSKMLLLVYDEQKAFVRVMNLFSPINVFSLKDFEFGLQLYCSWRERIKKTTVNTCTDSDYMCVRNPMDMLTSGVVSSLIMSVGPANFTNTVGLPNLKLAREGLNFLKQFVVERDIYNTIRKELAALALFVATSYMELSLRGVEKIDEASQLELVAMVENSICLGAFESIIYHLHTFHLYYSNKYVGERMHDMIKCLLCSFGDTVLKLWTVQFNENHAELCFEYDRPLIQPLLLMIGSVYKHLHYTQTKLIDEYWGATLSGVGLVGQNPSGNKLAEFVVSLAQHVNSGELYGICAKVLNRLCYNETSAASLSSLMENREVVYGHSTVANVFNLDIFLDVVEKLQSGGTSFWENTQQKRQQKQQKLCTFDYFVVNSFFKLLCNLFSYDCSVFRSALSTQQFPFVQHLVQLYFTSSAEVKIRTKILRLFRLLSRHSPCARYLYAQLHEPRKQSLFLATITDNVLSTTTIPSGRAGIGGHTYKFVRELLSLLRFWMFRKDHQQHQNQHSTLVYHIFVLFVEHILPSVEIFRFKSEMQRIQLTSECFWLIRDILTNVKLKIGSLKIILTKMTHFNSEALDVGFMRHLALPSNEACIYKLIFSLLADTPTMRALCALFVFNNEVIDSISPQHEFFSHYCDVMRNCVHMFAYLFDCESILAPIITESHLPLPPKKLALLLFSLADESRLNVFHTLVNVCCNQLLPEDVVVGALRLVLNSTVLRHTEIQSHLITLYTRDELQLSRLVIGFASRIRTPTFLKTPSTLSFTSVTKNRVEESEHNGDNSVNDGDDSSESYSEAASNLILDLLFRMSLSSPNKFTIAHVLLFGIKSPLELFHLKSLCDPDLLFTSNIEKDALFLSEHFFSRAPILKKLVDIMELVHFQKTQAIQGEDKSTPQSSIVIKPFDIEVKILRIFYANINHPCYGSLFVRYIRLHDSFYMPNPCMHYFGGVINSLSSLQTSLPHMEYITLIMGFIKADLSLALANNNKARVVTIVQYLCQERHSSVLLRLLERLPLDRIDAIPFAKTFDCFSPHDIQLIMSNAYRNSVMPEQYLGDEQWPRAVFYDEAHVAQLLSTYAGVSSHLQKYPAKLMHEDISAVLNWIMDTNLTQRLEFSRCCCVHITAQLLDMMLQAALEHMEQQRFSLLLKSAELFSHILIDKAGQGLFISTPTIVTIVCRSLFTTTRFALKLLDVQSVINLPAFYLPNCLQSHFQFGYSFLKTKSTLAHSQDGDYVEASAHIYGMLLMLIEIHVSIIRLIDNHSHGNNSHETLFYQQWNDKSQLDGGANSDRSSLAKSYKTSLENSLNLLSETNCINIVIHDAFNCGKFDTCQIMALTLLSKALDHYDHSHFWFYSMSQSGAIDNIVAFVCDLRHKTLTAYDGEAINTLSQETIRFFRVYQSAMHFFKRFTSTSMGADYLCNTGVLQTFVEKFPHLEDYQSRSTQRLHPDRSHYEFSNNPLVYSRLNLSTKVLLPFFQMLGNFLVFTVDNHNLENVVSLIITVFERNRENIVTLLNDAVPGGILNDGPTNFSASDWVRLELAAAIVKTLSNLAFYYHSECESLSKLVTNSFINSSKLKNALWLLVTALSSSKMFQIVCSLSGRQCGFGSSLATASWDNYDVEVATKLLTVFEIERGVLQYFCHLLTFEHTFHHKTAFQMPVKDSVFLLSPSLFPMDSTEINRVNLMGGVYGVNQLEFKKMKPHLSDKVGLGLLSHLVAQSTFVMPSLKDTINQAKLALDDKDFNGSTKNLDSATLLRLLQNYGSLKHLGHPSESQQHQLVRKFFEHATTLYTKIEEALSEILERSFSNAGIDDGSFLVVPPLLQKLMLETRKIFDESHVEKIIDCLQQTNSASSKRFCETLLANIVKIVQ